MKNTIKGYKGPMAREVSREREEASVRLRQKEMCIPIFLMECDVGPFIERLRDQISHVEIVFNHQEKTMSVDIFFREKK